MDSIAPTIFDAKLKQVFRRRLLAWYTKNARDLPWRRNRNAYRVWISEVMLQQTQVETVRPYFQRFLKAFPTVQKLATAEEQQVLRLWEGLGYYRRARGLHAAAKKIVAEHGGRIPRDAKQLQALPGIGRYTSGAILSIAFDQRQPILEANTIRLFARLIGYCDDPTQTAGQKLLWQTAEELLPRLHCGQFNQALMELGSLLCTPVDPHCEQCPVATLCAANKGGLQRQIPRTKKQAKFTDLNEAAVVVWKKSQVLMRQCPEGERWAGLWDFPRFALDSESPQAIADELQSKVHLQTGISIRPGALLQTIKHGVTRYRITLDCYEANYVSGRVRSTSQRPVRWVSLAKLADLPLCTTGRKLARLIAKLA